MHTDNESDMPNNSLRVGPRRKQGTNELNSATARPGRRKRTNFIKMRMEISDCINNQDPNAMSMIICLDAGVYRREKASTF